MYRRVRLLLLLPFVAMLWVPSYNRLTPRLFAIPFFYWYQMLWILLTGVLVGIVLLVERGGERR